MLLAYLVAVAQQNSLEDVAWSTRDSPATAGKNPSPKKRRAARPSLGCLCPHSLAETEHSHSSGIVKTMAVLGGEGVLN